MSQKLNPWSGVPFLDANGDPYSGAQLFVYQAGSSTKQTTTKDLAGVSNHANPIILNSSGVIADGSGAAQAMWQPVGQTVKLVLAPSTDTDPPIAAIRTYDDISGLNDTTVSISQWIGGQTPTFVSTTTFTVSGDHTLTYQLGRRIKCIQTSGTEYGTISLSAYTSLTTITVVMDDGVSLDSGLSQVDLGLIEATNESITSYSIKDLATTTAGTLTAYTITRGLTAYTTDQIYPVNFHTTNGVSPTINFDSLGAKTIKTCDGYTLAPGVLEGPHTLMYDGTDMILVDYTPRLLAEYVTAGSADTNIDFTGLDLKSHNYYLIEIATYNNAATSEISMYVNADYTATNYYSKVDQSSGAVYTAVAPLNNARISNASSSDYNSTFINLHLINNNGTFATRAEAIQGRNTLSNPIRYDIMWGKSATVTNVTSIRFTSAVASVFGIGTKIRIYRGDV